MTMIKITLIILLAFNVCFAVEMYSVIEHRGDIEKAEVVIDKNECDSEQVEYMILAEIECKQINKKVRDGKGLNVDEKEKFKNCKTFLKSYKNKIDTFYSIREKVKHSNELIYVESKKCEGNFDRLNYNEIFINNLELEPGEYDVTYEVKANHYNCNISDRYPLVCRGAENFRVIKVNERVFKDKYTVSKRSSRHIIGFGEKINKFFVQPYEIDGSFKIILKNREGVKLAEEEFKVPLLVSPQKE